MSLHLTTLGSANASAGGSDLRDLPARRLRYGLLVYLAIEGDVSRDVVAALFWPDRDRARGKHALRQMLYELRQLLGTEWLELRRNRIVVRATVDALEFEAAAAEGRTEAALGLYRGTFLNGFSLDNRAFEDWADRRRAHLSRVHRRLRREQIAALDASGDSAAAVRAAYDWVAVDPLDDEAAHAVIERLAVSGQRAAAIQYYDKYEQALRAELEVEPLDETRALVAAIRDGGSLSTKPLTRAIDEAAAALPPAEHSAAVPVSTRRLSWVSMRGAAAAAAVMVVLSLIAFTMKPGRPAGDAGRTRIAVLPFDDHSGDGSFGPLASALTSTLAHALAQTELIDVISPNGVVLMRAQGTPEDSLGRLLGADYLVGASIVRSDARVRVAVELLDGRTGAVLETDDVERPALETRVLVDDVVREAATFLRREVGRHIAIERVRSHTGSEQAWRLVLDAKALQEQLARLIKQGDLPAVKRDLLRADSLLAAAAEMDRTWAEPVVLRGWVRERLAFLARLTDPADASGRRALLEQGLGMADAASARNADWAGTSELRGVLLHQLALLPTSEPDSVTVQMDRAEQELRTATAFDPFNQSAWRRLGELLYTTGHYGDAKNAAERAYRIDPYSPDANVVVNLLFATSFELGEDDHAEGWCFEGRRRFANELPFLYCLLALHAWADGVQPDPGLAQRNLDAFQQAHMRAQPQLTARFQIMIAAAHARASEHDSARALLAAIATDSPDPALLWMRAGAHVELGENAAAVDLLRRYIERGGRDAARTARTRPFWALRGDPRYEQLLGDPRS